VEETAVSRIVNYNRPIYRKVLVAYTIFSAAQICHEFGDVASLLTLRNDDLLTIQVLQKQSYSCIVDDVDGKLHTFLIVYLVGCDVGGGEGDESSWNGILTFLLVSH
jgi:hypothetical protein